MDILRYLAPVENSGNSIPQHQDQEGFWSERWKASGYLQGSAEVCVMGEVAGVSPASLYFLFKYCKAVECLMLAPEIIQHPNMGRAKLASGRHV